MRFTNILYSVLALATIGESFLFGWPRPTASGVTVAAKTNSLSAAVTFSTPYAVVAQDSITSKDYQSSEAEGEDDDLPLDTTDTDIAWADAFLAGSFLTEGDYVDLPAVVTSTDAATDPGPLRKRDKLSPLQKLINRRKQMLHRLRQRLREVARRLHDRKILHQLNHGDDSKHSKTPKIVQPIPVPVPPKDKNHTDHQGGEKDDKGGRKNGKGGKKDDKSGKTKNKGGDIGSIGNIWKSGNNGTSGDKQQTGDKEGKRSQGRHGKNGTNKRQGQKGSKEGHGKGTDNKKGNNKHGGKVYKLPSSWPTKPTGTQHHKTTQPEYSPGII